MNKEQFIAKLTDGTPDHADPALRKYWQVVRLLGLVGFLLVMLLPLVLVTLFVATTGGGLVILFYLLVILSVLLVIPLAAYAVFTRLEFENYSFNIQKTHLTINKGVLHKRSLTIPYDRVQNVTITSGPLMRRFGISTVTVSTAGYTGLLGESIEGISEPEIVRDIILQRVKGARARLPSEDIGL